MSHNQRLFRHLFLAGVFLLCGICPCPAFATDIKVLSGHVPTVVSSLTPKGRLAATNELLLAIGLPLRDPAGLDQYLAQIYDPASPHFHQYLTPIEAADRFGPTPGDYEAVKDFARTNGLTVTTTYNNRLVLDVTGPAAAVENALHITLRTYRHPTEARDFFAPDTEPTVEAQLPMADIQGLSDYARPHPRLHRMNAATMTGARPKDGSAPDGSGAYFGNDFRNAYVPGTTLTGAGQTLGLFEADGFYANDIATYAGEAGNGRANIVIQTVLLNGFSGRPTTGADSGNGEVSLDIEMAMAMAPGLARIVVYEGNPNKYLPNNILNSMLAGSNTVKNLSCSWGWSGGPSTTTDNIFKNMAVVGQSFYNAAGDSDAFTAGAGSVNGVDNTSLANAPSSSPYITQVGATTLTMNGSGASYASETVWNWGVEYGSAYDGVGTSGGVSSYYTIPSWQMNINVTAPGGSSGFRNIPDVALTGDNVYVAYGNGQSAEFGGTSCAAPLWAGFTALANQQASVAGRTLVGFINPALYAIASGSSYASCFHDVTTGNNTWSNSPTLFYAANGYDLCTGLGTPAGTNLINALATPANPLLVSPASGFTTSGPNGGPFDVTSQNFTLTNQSGSSLFWNIINSPSWLNVSPSSGTLAGGAETTVTVSLTAAANSLAVGAYSADLLVTNFSGLAASLPFTLNAIDTNQPIVANGGFETGSLSSWTLNGSTKQNFVTTTSGFVHSGSYGMALGQEPSLGYLYQTLATTPGQNYLLSLWLTNPSNPDGATPNQFLVQWNGTTLFNQTNIPFTTWTNLQFVVTATNASTVLQFGFEDTPYFLALDDVSVVPLSPPTFNVAQPATTGFNLTWNTIAGQVYQVQYKTNLTQPNWIDLGNPLTATTNTLTLQDTDAITASPSRFYRVVEQP